MNSFRILLFGGIIGVSVTGCGSPLQMPMPLRPNAEQQKKIDGTWQKALDPVNRFDHQGLLDLLTVSKAYEVGVDKLTFRSEKRVAGGTIVMEIHYDRLAPADDRFECKLMDGAGRMVRNERYNRDNVEKTSRELLVEYDKLRRQKEQGTLSPEAVRRLAGYETRIRAIEAIFPKDEKPERRK
jgi:hypothetical protein